MFLSELERQKEHSRCACFIDTVSFTFPLTHSKQLQHYIICVGVELDSTALEDDGTEFLHSTKHIAQCHIVEGDGSSSFLALTTLHIATSQKMKAVVPS
jgi:hypothetical protein